MPKKRNGKQDAGLAVLSAGTSLAAWSAVNSSYFTIATFADDAYKIQKTREAMAIGVATCVAIGGGTYLVWGRKAKFASLAAILTGLGLWGLYEWQLRKREEMLGLRANMSDPVGLADPVGLGEIRVD